jgi:orotate phosphoribosyltransferase
MNDIAVQVARALLDIGAVTFAPQSPITFKSGLISPVYVDNRRLPYWPEQWQVIIGAFKKLMKERDIQFDIIAGIEAAGIPHSAALGYTMRRPSVFVRKRPKGHGMKNRVEGGAVSGKRVVLVEDLVTTGGSSLSGIAALRDDGAIVEHCLVIVSYGFPQAAQAFEQAGVRLQTLTSFPVIVQEAVQLGSFTDSEQSVIESWLRDPIHWAEQNGYA